VSVAHCIATGVPLTPVKKHSNFKPFWLRETSIRVLIEKFHVACAEFFAQSELKILPFVTSSAIREVVIAECSLVVMTLGAAFYARPCEMHRGLRRSYLQSPPSSRPNRVTVRAAQPFPRMLGMTKVQRECSS
jgi:hypothetical protein